MYTTIFSRLLSLRMAVVTLLIILLLYMTSVVYRYGVADIKHYQATSIMSQWSRDDDSVLRNWRESRLMLYQVNELHPDNPYYLELLAKVDARLARQSRGAVAEILYREALDSLQHAIKQRPVSPYTWLNIAKLKARLGEFDELFSIAVASAIKFGSWIETIQQAVAVISFRYWEQLPLEIKPLMVDNLNRAAQIQLKGLFTLAERYRASHLLCSLVSVKLERCVINELRPASEKY